MNKKKNLSGVPRNVRPRNWSYYIIEKILKITHRTDINILWSIIMHVIFEFSDFISI